MSTSSFAGRPGFDLWETVEGLRDAFGSGRPAPRMGRGDVRTAILVSLAEAPGHGYQIIQAKYAVATPESISRVAGMLNRYSDRFLFGTDTVAPAGPGPYFQGVAIQPRPGAQVAQETDRPMPTYAGIKHRGDDHDTTH